MPSVLVSTHKAPKEEISMQNPTTQKTPKLVHTVAQESREEQIRCRAYELYEERGREDGHDVEDWLRAEAEIIGRTEEAVAA
jgi:Protein of unknown function (DUF2934)